MSTKRLMLQIASDLHLEFTRKDFDIKKIGNCLALVGDIGVAAKNTYEPFIKKQSDLFEHVFVLAGNHEYYGQEYNAANSDIKSICGKYSNVHFLQQSSFLYEDGSDKPIRVLGCTLWSNVPPNCEDKVLSYLNDYRVIKIKEEGEEVRKLTVRDTNRMHQEDLNWLKNEIESAKQRGERVVVLTHHAPLDKGTSAPQYEVETNLARTAFATDLQSMICSKNMELWAYGHTHYNNEIEMKGTFVVSNQAGYSNERGVNYNSNQCFVFEKDGIKPVHPSDKLSTSACILA
ncbi:hypothetical protein AKO1_015763 [Acrasis kona]|uniref:Calcineurin-like phosphoesterase domain-containing protein n=1 Tax=Acrasis kona TaxID=1008807 RepID=A0AAW2ZFD5_9EUKA